MPKPTQLILEEMKRKDAIKNEKIIFDRVSEALLNNKELKIDRASIENVVRDCLQHFGPETKRSLRKLKGFHTDNPSYVYGKKVGTVDTLAADIKESILKSQEPDSAHRYFVNHYKAKYDRDKNMEKTNIGTNINLLRQNDLKLEKKLNAGNNLKLGTTTLQATRNPIDGIYTEEERTKIAALSLGIIAKVVGSDSMLKTRTLYQDSLKDISTLPPEVIKNILQAAAEIVQKPHHKDLTPDTAITLGKMIGKNLREELERKKAKNQGQDSVPDVESIVSIDIKTPILRAALAIPEMSPTSKPTPTKPRKGRGL